MRRIAPASMILGAMVGALFTRIILLAAVAVLIAFTMNGSLGGPASTTSAQNPPNPLPPVVVNYTATDAVFPNPERGFLRAERIHSWGYTPLDLGTLQGYRQDGITLIKRVFYLDDFVPNYYNLPAWPWPAGYDFLTENPSYPVYDGTNANPVNIPGDYLVKMQDDFDKLRGAGLKAVVRFAYTNKRFDPPFEDADLQAVLDHLDQLQPILRLNSDVIALVEAGFIGNWGEWFYTDHFIEDPLNLQASPFEPEYITANDYANRGLVLSKILEVLPDHLVQLRTPHYKYQIYDEPSPYSAPRPLPTPLSAVNAHDGSNIARTGHHNDCFLGNDTDAGTYGSWLSISDDKDYLAAETNYVPMGGEVCNPGGGGPTRFDGLSTLAELERFHWSYLNVETGAQGNEVYDGWATDGSLPEIKQRLGYRLALLQGTYTDVVQSGGAFVINIQLRNDGWAAPFNPRPVELVLRHTGTGDIHTIPLPGEDPRLWSAGDTQTLDHTIQADMPPGEYELLLHLPDSAPSLASRPEYAIRTANDGTWEEGTGYNNLGHTLVVETTDVCPNDPSDDVDGDGICVGNGFNPPKTGDNDNCPTTPNPGQENADGDQWGDDCETVDCVNQFTPWVTPDGDVECDGSVTGDANSGETFFGTDPADACSDTPTMYDERGSLFGEPEPAWAFDINDDQLADFGDILAFAPHFNKTFPDPAYSARFDFFIDQTVDFGDVLQYVAYFNKDCTDYFAP